MTRPFLHVRTAAGHGQARVDLVGEIDMDTAPRLREALAGCLAQRPERLHVGMAGVAFCDGAGLRVLLWARAVAAGTRTSLYLEQVRPQVARLFTLTGTEVHFSLEREVGDAVGPPAEPAG